MGRAPLHILHTPRRLSCVLGALALVGAGPSLARSQSQAEGKALLSEPIEWTNVADAFEEGDLVDVEVHLGFRRSFDGATIEREVVTADAADGRATRRFVGVAQHERTRNELIAELDLGVYRDVMLYLRLPILLGEAQELRAPDGERCSATSASAGCQRLRETLPDGRRLSLFDLGSPLRSRTRSGLPMVDLGVAWSVTNQYRSAHFPTWVLRLETSFDTGALMRPCLENGSCSPGVSRGTAGLQLESRWSHRYRYVEPFFGVGHRLEWVSGGAALFEPSGAGVVDGDPPSVTSMTAGAAVIPWEDRGRFQRFEAGLGMRADFVGPGRDASPLFDALGTSENPYLTAPNYTSLPPDREPVLFTGLTNVEGHGRFTFDLKLVMQAARYVRFSLGAGLSYATPHLITGASPCDDGVSPERGDPRIGGCEEGIYNPVYRFTIDAPGNRFRVNDVFGFRLQGFAAGTF